MRFNFTFVAIEDRLSFIYGQGSLQAMKAALKNSYSSLSLIIFKLTFGL